MRQKKIPPTTALHITLLAGLFAALLSGCHLTQKSAPSVIVLAVDNLGVNQINCNQDTHATGMDSNSRSPRSGFAQMCQESVRFTHAFTTSPLAGPATASLLTGQYPLQHGLRDNRNFLSSRILSVAEVAQKKGVATSFFSGGAPILRKLNLQQGFETFDDNFVPTSTLLFRPFRRTEKIFENWLKEIGRQPFLSIFYLPDLNFSFSPTVNSLGQVRELNFESQLEEIDESLFSLIETLKKNKAWDSTMIILVGLNGPQSSNEGELAATDLFSERTQVSLLIKPAQKPRDQGMNWGFDQNVNLADVGATLMEIYGGEALSSLTSLPVFGLQDILKNPSGNSVGEPKWDRPLLIESGWAEISQIRSAETIKHMVASCYNAREVLSYALDELEARMDTSLSSRSFDATVLSTVGDTQSSKLIWLVSAIAAFHNWKYRCDVEHNTPNTLNALARTNQVWAKIDNTVLARVQALLILRDWWSFRAITQRASMLAVEESQEAIDEEVFWTSTIRAPWR